MEWMAKMAYAHSLRGRPRTEWHRLEHHLRGTAERSPHFLEPWGAGDWAHLATLRHDPRKHARFSEAHIGGGDPDVHIECPENTCPVREA